VVAASAATVEVAVAEKEEDETGLQERERESRWLLGGRAGFLWWSWCSWWYIVWVYWYSRRRRQLWQRWKELQKADGESRKMETGGRLVFCDFWTRFYPLSGHTIHLYL
jgi:hypothetical protein